jgi:hypothetical protein
MDGNKGQVVIDDTALLNVKDRAMKKWKDSGAYTDGALALVSALEDYLRGKGVEPGFKVKVPNA